MPTPRPSPYVWVSWLTRLLAGKAYCVWSAWFEAHYREYVRAPAAFDATGWQIEHAALLRRTRDESMRAGYRVRVESENAFVLNGSCGSSAGKPDLIALRYIGDGSKRQTSHMPTAGVLARLDPAAPPRPGRPWRRVTA